MVYFHFLRRSPYGHPESTLRFREVHFEPAVATNAV